MGYGPAGARQLKSAIQRLVIQPLALHLLENKTDLLKKSEAGALKLHITGVGEDFNVKVQKKPVTKMPANKNTAEKKKKAAPTTK